MSGRRLMAGQGKHHQQCGVRRRAGDQQAVLTSRRCACFGDRAEDPNEAIAARQQADEAGRRASGISQDDRHSPSLALRHDGRKGARLEDETRPLCLDADRQRAVRGVRRRQALGLCRVEALAAPYERLSNGKEIVEEERDRVDRQTRRFGRSDDPDGDLPPAMRGNASAVGRSGHLNSCVSAALLSSRAAQEQPRQRQPPRVRPETTLPSRRRQSAGRGGARCRAGSRSRGRRGTALRNITTSAYAFDDGRARQRRGGEDAPSAETTFTSSLTRASGLRPPGKELRRRYSSSRAAH